VGEVAEVARPCGDCTFCCKVMAVPEVGTKAGTWCSECQIGVGCKIYEDRPESCQVFGCAWAMSLDFPEEARPDRVKVMFHLDEIHGLPILLARCDPGRPLAYRKPLVADMIQKLNKAGYDLIMITGKVVDIFSAPGYEWRIHSVKYTDECINVKVRTKPRT